MVSVTLRRTALSIVFAALGGPLLDAAPALAGPPPALAPGGSAQVQPTQPQPGDVVFIMVSPSTVEPGFLVGIRASCRDNTMPAMAVSDAFGRIQLQPQRGELSASPMVKDRTRPGNYRIKLECPDGATASTMLQVVKAVGPSRGPAGPSRGPATGFGGTAGGGTDGLLLPGGLALTIAGAAVGIVAARRPRGAARR